MESAVETDFVEKSTVPAFISRPFARLAYERWGNEADDKLINLAYGTENIFKKMFKVPAILCFMPIAPVLVVDSLLEIVLPHRKFTSIAIVGRVFEDADWLTKHTAKISHAVFQSLRDNLPADTIENRNTLYKLTGS